jgi:acetamidase/formamidase
MPDHDYVFECGGLFGCGDSGGICMFESQAVHAAVPSRVRDRLSHLEAFDREAIEPYLESYRQTRRRLLGLGGILGVLAVVKPAKLLAAGRRLAGGHVVAALPAGGREHVVESLPETVRLGVLDATLPNILEVEPGDVIIYPNTWSHFLNRLQPGVSLQQLAQWRRDNPGRGPHSIIGPVGVKGAQRGDMVSIRFVTLTPQNWGANFNNPGDLRTGALWGEFPDGQVRYLAIDAEQRQAKFAPSIELPIGPFQGTFGVAAPDDREVVGHMAAGIVSSVPPGQHAGNLDLRELTEGSTLYIPVWQTDAKLFTGDSHALQGDGEVNLTALETAMREVRVQVGLHEQPRWEWPFAETPDHWIAMGMHRDLSEAFKIALRNTLDFLGRKAGLSRLDAYALASLAVHFRITQVVDITQGVHAMIPKNIFAPPLRATISIA